MVMECTFPQAPLLFFSLPPFLSKKDMYCMVLNRMCGKGESREKAGASARMAVMQSAHVEQK